MDTAFSDQHSAVSEKQNQHQHQRLFTTEVTEDTEAEKVLSRNHGKPGDEQERVQQHAQALALKLAQTYEELTRLLERNPGMKQQITAGTTREDKVYQKLKQRLKMADMAPRCQWVKQDGTSCGSPQMKKHIYCFAHMQMAEARELMLRLPPPEDANAIQIGIMRIQKSLIEGTISTKIAGLLLYSMQLALTNVGQTTFGQAKEEEMVRDTVDEDEAFSQKQELFTAKDAEDAEERKRNQQQNQRPFTAEDTEKNQGSPLINTDDTNRKGLPRMEGHDRGLGSEIKPVVWRPTPDMYRTDTPEGREAYEACLRMTMAPQLGAERRPVQPVIAPDDRAETLAILG